MKKSIALLIVGLCCIMTACSAKPADSQTNTQSSATVKPTTKPVQVTAEAPSTEPPTTQKPTEPPTEQPTDPPTEPSKDTAWKQLYIDFINTLNEELYQGFKLIYIDEDDVPELLAIAGSRITPGYMCWVYNDSLYQENVQLGDLYYYERENYFLTRSWFPPAGWDHIKKIDGSETVEISHGNTNTTPGQESYKWNDEELGSSSAYESALNSELNTHSAQTTDNLKSYAEICKQIKDY